MIHDKYVPTTDNIDDFKFNEKEVNYSLSRYYQRNDNDNLILTYKNQCMNAFFLK